MYRLYDYDKHEIIKASPNEAEIFNELSKCMEEIVGQRYLVVWDDDETKAPDWIAIRSVRDYYNYALEYNNRLKQKSCMELKKEIVKDVKIKKIRR